MDLLTYFGIDSHYHKSHSLHKREAESQNYSAHVKGA